MRNISGDKLIWVVFKKDNAGSWSVVSRYKYYRDLKAALKSKDSLTLDPDLHGVYQVFGFASLNTMKITLGPDEAARRTIEATFDRYLYERKKPSLRRSSPGSPASSVEPPWNLIKSWLKSGHLGLAQFFTLMGYHAIDKRPKGGCLWIVGDSPQLKALMPLLHKNIGVRFRFTPEGGRASRHQPAWYNS